MHSAVGSSSFHRCDRCFHPSRHAVPSRPPSSVKATLIEEATALVSWKPPDDPNAAVTHYTVLYASRHDWIAGEWQVLQREGKEVLQSLCAVAGARAHTSELDFQFLECAALLQ